MEKIEVKHSSGKYMIFAGEDILTPALAEFFGSLERPYDRVFIVSETNVFPLHGERVKEIISSVGADISGEYVFDAGERSKNLATVSGMYDAFAKAKLTRKSLVVCLGGGVTGDMGGFAAATYLRGIDVLQIPTTLLSQIDSSIGGKTGVDLSVGKNLVGAFHQPVAVISDSRFLDTLPGRFIDDGMGEAIKTGCISDAGLFEGVAKKTIGRGEMISKCAAFKADVVTKDEFETGLRKILNYGHTIGHAVEKLGNFERFSHGESVGIGMLYAARVGGRLGYKPLFDEIKSALCAWELPTVMDYPAEELIKAASSDKKRTGDSVSFILLEDIGRPVVREIPINELGGLIV